MSRRAREIETLLLTMLAAAPLYLTDAVSMLPLILFHLAMTAIVVRVAAGKGPELVPAEVMRIVAMLYIPFYVIDATMLSQSAIAASTHLVLFIAVYQPTESLRSANQAQRLLTTALIFVASLATSTHIAIVPFVVFFAFVMFRQLMYVSHLETTRMLGREYCQAPASRAAIFYLVGATLIGALLFPLLPRTRNPLIQGRLGPLANSATGLSETIDFNDLREQPNDSTVVARVWMGPDTIPFFSPIRLRGAVYDRYANNQWLQTRGEFRDLRARDGSFRVARPEGFTRNATMQMRLERGRLYLPVGTYSVRGVSNLFEGPMRGRYMTLQQHGETATVDVSMAMRTEPLRVQRVPVVRYPITPEVAALARQIAGDATTIEQKARRVEAYLSRNYEYIPLGQNVRQKSTDDFLLRDKRGHCEYFAAGMVVLLTALDIPARVAGGYYGGQFNPLGGYFIVRRDDAHAWAEVWSGTSWLTYDPTPPGLRPGGSRANVVRAYFAAFADSLTYFWDRYVLTYGFADQVALLADALTRSREAMGSLRAGLASGVHEVLSPRYLLALALLVALGGVAIVVSRGRRPVFDLLAAHLKRLDIEVSPAMTIEEAVRTLRRQHPEAAEKLEPLIALYEEERFSATQDRARAATIRRKLAELRT